MAPNRKPVLHLSQTSLVLVELDALQLQRVAHLRCDNIDRHDVCSRTLTQWQVIIEIIEFDDQRGRGDKIES
jgi:hypothetical protein